jgi:hypothetical protein
MQAVAMLVLIGVMLFTMPLLGALGGAFAGWVVGWFFDETILGILGQLGVKNVAMWQFGMFLGFVGGFFKASLSTSKD